MKITTKIVRRPPCDPTPPSETPNILHVSIRVTKPFSEAPIDLQPPPGCGDLIAALPPTYDPFTDSLVLTFLWRDSHVEPES